MLVEPSTDQNHVDEVRNIYVSCPRQWEEAPILGRTHSRFLLVGQPLGISQVTPLSRLT